jgi:myo-inositol-1(or 4)-monophosphatase
VRELVTELAFGLRRQILPQLGAYSARALAQQGAGGDITFAIDEQAEHFAERFIAERLPRVAFYSEDRGLVEPAAKSDGQVLVIDPVDGTRPALAGLESCCVSVAAAVLGDGRPVMGDVWLGCVLEIKSGALFLAERGQGIALRGPDGARSTPALSPNQALEALFWTSGFRGRPAGPLVEVLGELIDTSSVGGGFFDLGSASFDMTRILTGQLDAYVDVGSRMIDELPGLRKDFERVGGGAVLNNSPYDLAAAALCLQEAGAIVSDAHGRALDDRPLLGSGHDFQMSCVAASNAQLHSSLLSTVDRGIERLLARHR